MNSSLKEELKKRLRKDSLILDLSDLQTLNEDILSYILKRFEKSSSHDSSSTQTTSTNSTSSSSSSSSHSNQSSLSQLTNVGSIKLNPKLALNQKCKKILDKIESYLIRNNETFNIYPNDYTHCLLASHCYNHSSLNLSPKPMSSISKSPSSFTFLSRFSTSNTTPTDPADDDFKHDSKYRALRDEWKLFEVFQLKEYKSILYTNEKKNQLVLAFHIHSQPVKKTDLVAYTLYAYLHTKRAVELAEIKNYYLSFTGYSLSGSSLAELSVYFCNKYFFKITKAVTFESPGQFLGLNHQVVTYLLNPNFVNCHGKHSTQSYMIGTHDLADDFYSLGCKSLTAQNLDLILKELESPVTKSKLKQISKWPKIECEKFDETTFDFDTAFYSIQLTGDSISKEIKQIFLNHQSSLSSSSTFPKQDMLQFVDALYNTYTVVYAIRRLNNINPELGVIHLNDHELVINNELKLDEVNLTRMHLTNLSDDLVKLAHLNTSDLPCDEFLIKQLNSLKALYRIVVNYDAGFSIESQIEIKRLRDRLFRYYLIEPELKSQISKPQEIRAFNTKLLINRTSELLNIENVLRQEQFCCLHGPVASGKSTLARLYHTSRMFKYKMKWIDAESFEKILFNFRVISYELNIHIDAQTRLDFFTLFKIKLNSLDRKFLFVIDNLLDEQDLEFLESGFDPANIKFIITTSKNISDKFKRVEIKAPSRDECLRAIDPKYHNVYNLEPDMSLIKLNRLITIQNESIINYRNNYLSYSHLIKQECLKAFDILTGLAYLDGNYNISLDLIQTIFIDEHSADFNEALVYLIKGNLLQSDTQNRLAIHNLIQNEILIDRNARKSFILDRISLALNQLLNENNLNDLAFNEILFKQAVRILKEDWKTKKRNKNCADLFYKLGLIYETILFEYKDALNCYKEAQNIYKQLGLASDFILDRIAVNYTRLDLHEDAIMCYKEILSVKKSHQVLVILAQMYEKLKQLDQAQLAYKEAIDLLNQTQSQSDEAIQLHEKMAQISLSQKNYPQALNTYTQLLEIRKETLMSNDPSIGQCLCQIGNINYQMNKYDEALKSYKDALKVYKDTMRESDHASVVHVLNSIGNINFHLGQLDEALKHYREALKLKQENNESSPAVAMILNNVGLVLNRMDKFDEALENFKQALVIKKENLSENHFSIGNTLNNIGNSYFKLKQLDEALKYYNDAFKLFSEMSPCNFACLADTLANIGVVYKRMGKHDQALENYKEVLKIRREKTSLLNDNHPSIAKILNNIGNVHLQLGNNDEALNNYRESLRIYKETLPSNHFSIANTLFNMEIVNKEINI